MIRELKEEIKSLSSEIQELKKENNDDDSNDLSYVDEKENDLKVKQSRLDQLLSVVEINEHKPPKDDNSLPIILIVCVIGVISLLGLIAYKVRKNKIKR